MKCLRTRCIQTRYAYHTVTCVPKLLWTPKHRLHRKTPNVVDANRGFLPAQSAQTLFAVSWQFHTQPTSIMSSPRQVGSDACARGRLTLTCKSLFRAPEVSILSFVSFVYVSLEEDNHTKTPCFLFSATNEAVEGG